MQICHVISLWVRSSSAFLHNNNSKIEVIVQVCYTPLPLVGKLHLEPSQHMQIATLL